MFKLKIAFLAAIILCAGTALIDARAQTRDELASARQDVAEFEARLVQLRLAAKNESELRMAEKSQRAIRAFFDGLDGSAMRVAAIEMLDTRYVSVVSRELTAKLLGPLIRDADQAVRSRAAKAIGYNNCGAQYFDELTGMLNGEPSTDALRNIAYAMGRSGHQAFVPYLVELLNHADADVRSTALFELNRLAPKQAVAHNLRLLDDEQPSVRSGATQNLVRFPGRSAITAVEGMLADKDYSVRERAVVALGEMRSARSADVIAKRLSDEDHRVRGHAALVLGQLHATRHAPSMAALLNDEDVVARRYATKAFGAMGAPEFIEDLRPLLNDADDQVREYAAAAIAELEDLTAGRDNQGNAE